MRKQFSIINKLDLEKLNTAIDSFKNQSSILFADGYLPIILMSPDTLGDMHNLPNTKYVGINTKNNCTGMVGKYYGCKVFSDPTLKYGEVELR